MNVYQRHTLKPAAYQTIIAQVTDGIIVLDLQKRGVELNPAAEGLLGCTESQALGQPITQILPNYHDAWMALDRTKQPIEITLGEDVQRRHIQVYTSPLRDASEATTGWLLVLHDVTACKRRERINERLTQRLEAGLRAGNLAWWEMELPSGKVVFDDRKAEMLGYAPERFETYEDFTKLLHPDDYERAMQAMQDHLEGRVENYEIEYRIKTRSGAYRWFRDMGGTTSHINEEGNAYVIGLVEDITERKKAEEKLEHYAADLKRSNEDLEQFAYVVSHDLQAPARTVRNYVELLARRHHDQLDEEANTLIDYAVKGAERMQKMIGALLRLSRVETKGKDLTPTDVESLLKHTLDSLHQTIRETEATVTYDPLPTLMADEAQLAQVFQNLIANAIKFRRENVLPHVHISAEPRGDEWLFSIRDNGIGMDPEHGERIFQIFQRLHTEEEYPGLGIGLALSKRIVERHSGRIWVESTPGEGSTFFFTLLRRVSNQG